MSQYLRLASESGPRATRLQPPDGIKVSARTMGTRLAFEIPVSNISRSGMLLEWKHAKQSLPFMENTLIELELTTTHRGEPKTISCMGKVVRRTGRPHDALYGIKMIHNEDHEHLDWLTMVTMFEKMAPQVD